MSSENSLNIKDTLIKVLELTKEKGYNEINQIKQKNFLRRYNKNR